MSGVPRANVVKALEALELADVEYASAVLRSALRDSPRTSGVECQRCGQRFRWPGLRDAHLATSRCGLEVRSRSWA